MEGARARQAKRGARGKRSVYAAKGPCARARDATVRTTGERRMRGHHRRRDEGCGRSRKRASAGPAPAPRALIPGSQSRSERPPLTNGDVTALDIGRLSSERAALRKAHVCGHQQTGRPRRTQGAVPPLRARRLRRVRSPGREPGDLDALFAVRIRVRHSDCRVSSLRERDRFQLGARPDR